MRRKSGRARTNQKLWGGAGCHTDCHCLQASNLRVPGSTGEAAALQWVKTHLGLRITAGGILWERQELWAGLSLHQHQHQQGEPHQWQLVRAVLASGALHRPECEGNVTAAALLPSESYQKVSYKLGARELRGEDNPGKCRSGSVKLWPFISTTEAHTAGSLPSHAQVSHPALSSPWMS